MRSFEKMLSLKLKEEAERIVPGFRLPESKMRETSDPESLNPVPDRGKGRHSFRKRLLASSAAMILIIILVSGYMYFSENRESGRSFQIIAFAGSEGMDENQLEERLLKADISMVMPNGQITLFQEGGPEPGAYGWGTGSFYVTGKDIDRVTYSLKNGLINHYDHAMEYKQNIEGNPVRIEFFLPYSVLNLDEAKIDMFHLDQAYSDRLTELWNSGECPDLEAVKKGYFQGKSLQIGNYSIMSFVGTWKAAQTDGRYFRLTDVALDKKLTKEAHKVTVEYYHFDYGKDFNYDDSIYGVTWSPVFKPYSTVGITNPEALPGDEMTVEIELKSGEIIKRVIELSFDKDGYVIAKVK
jgi:hypothetical protein